MGDMLIGEITQHSPLRIIKIEPQKTKNTPTNFEICRGYCLIMRICMIIFPFSDFIDI